MKPVPADPGGSVTNASVAASIATILELGASCVPNPGPDHPDPWTVWHNWLAQRALGLVPILDPVRFEWPGPWLALIRSRRHRELVGVVAFGAPPGIVWNPLGHEGSFDDVARGFVLAAADVALWSAAPATTARLDGTVELLAVAAEATGPMRAVEHATARAGRGLEGDRYFAGAGTFTNVNGRGHDLTLIEAEALEALSAESVRVAPADARRNVVTRGISLNALVGRRFRVGEAECLGQRLCEPCAHLERLTAPGALRGLVHRGGLRADLLSDGVIRVGDRVRLS